VDELMLKWSVDEDFWVRRVAIDHQLGRKEKTNTDLLEKILTNNFGSKEFFINKAIGWALRDYSKTNPDWVRYFIGKYKNKMDKLSIREGSKYI
jgi:3-methyladenine DNA glycosylase AlkD